MSEKITLPGIIGRLADATGDSRKETEDFIREFFSLLQSKLLDEGEVSIRQLGTFKVAEVEERKSVDVSTGEEVIIAAHKKLLFTPSKELAEEINAPFDMFETIELNDGFDPDSVAISEEAPSGDDENLAAVEEGKQDLVPDEIDEETGVDDFADELPESTVDDNIDKEGTIESSVDELEVSQNLNVQYPDDTVPQDDSLTSATYTDSTSNNEEFSLYNEYSETAGTQGAGTDDVSAVATDSELKDESVDHEFRIAQSLYPERKRKRGTYKFLSGFASGVALCCLVGLGVYIYMRNYVAAPAFKTEPSPTVVDSLAVEAGNSEVLKSSASEDSVISVDEDAPEVPTPVSDAESIAKQSQVVYDTISHTRFLTTMAKAHYGNYNLWPYIYKENESFLGHPDRIRPGTRVVVPPLSKYGVDPNNENDIRKAKQMGVEIYSRYK